MKRTKRLQEVRKMRFEQAYDGWRKGRLSQFEAARLLGVANARFGAISPATSKRVWTD